MASINIKAFRGQVPRISDRLLQPNQAKRAFNCKLTSGRLDPLAGLGLVFSTSSLIKTVYRYRVFKNNVFEDNWLTWSSDVDVVPSPVANDLQGKFYFSGELIEPRMSTYAVAINTTPYPTAWYSLGTAAPATAPSVIVVGGSSHLESRSYVYTYVTALGEESPPSPPSTLLSGHVNGSWDLSGIQTAPPNSGTVSAVTNLSNGRVRVTLNTVFGIAEYDTLTLAGVVGMTDLNASFRVLAVDAVNSRIEVALDTAQTYTSGGTWTRNAPYNTSGMVKRIYRTVGTGGDFLFVAEIPVATTTYSDTTAADSLGEVLPTAASLPPPKNLISLISLPNGCLVGISGNELCFSEPYIPYSWPLANRYSFSGRGVAAVSAGNSVIVLTDTFPILFTGSDPEAMSPSVMETYAPCVTKRGVVNVGGAAVYPSFDGLWLVSLSNVTSLTTKLYREDEWSKLSPSTFDAGFHDGRYYASYSTSEYDRIFVMDIGEPDGTIEVVDHVDCFYRNELDGKLYASKGEDLYEWDSDTGKPYESDWLSATSQLGKLSNFSVAQVHADYAAIVPVDTTQLAANEALIAAGADAVAGHLDGLELLATEINGSSLIPIDLDVNKKVQFTIYSNGNPVYTQNVSSSTPFRLPAGYLSEVFAIGLTASVGVFSATVAESVQELSQASQ